MAMKMILDDNGRVIAYGAQDNWPLTAPDWVDFTTFSGWICHDINDLNNQAKWTYSPVVRPNDASDKQKADIDFGNSLISEFNTSEQETAVDATTYQAIIDVFKYVLFALQMGNLVQAKNQLNAISTTAYAPVWDADKRNYFINKIDNYLNA